MISKYNIGDDIHYSLEPVDFMKATMSFLYKLEDFERKFDAFMNNLKKFDFDRELNKSNFILSIFTTYHK